MQPTQAIRRRTVISLTVLAALLVGSLGWRASWIATQLLRSWAATTIGEKSGDVYRLKVGRVRFNFLLRRAGVDSIDITTNRATNALRPRPLANLRLSFRQCTISGVHLMRLISNGGLVAESFGCQAVSVAVVVPLAVPDTAAQPRVGRQAFRVQQQSLRLPSFAPQVRIARIDFPRVALDFRLPHVRAGDTRLQLEQLRWRIVDLVIDPADTTAAARPLFSRVVELSAAEFVGSPDSVTVVRVGALVASLTDSTLELRGITCAPTLSDAAFERSGPYRQDLIKTSVDRIAVQGIDVGAFVLGHGLRARHVQVDSLRLELTSDKRRPSNPRPDRHSPPQGWIADLDRTLSVDSVLIRHAEIVYRERRAGHPRPGVITFARVEAVALNASHVVGRRTTRDPMTLRATAELQDLGRLDVQFAVPLDAPRFNLTFQGTLGAMPATSLNTFVRETFPARIATGRLLGITFHATVANGVAIGTITPRYNDLSVAVTRRGSEGILGGGGIVGGAARGVASFMENWTKVNANNPDDAKTPPRSGAIRHTFTSNETLPAFLWACVRDGLLAVVRK